MKNSIAILLLLLGFGCSEATNNNDLKNNKIETSGPIFVRNTECLFKSKANKQCWTRVGLYPIDSIAEKFACNLYNEDYNHILLAKYIGDNGAFPNEVAFVLWSDSGKDYVKEFYISDSLEVLESSKKEMNWESLRSLASSTRIDTVQSKPELEIAISHGIGFSVQYLSPNIYFCDRLQDNEWKSALDKTHSKVLFWKELTDLLKPTERRRLSNEHFQSAQDQMSFLKRDY
jgi:hypothetical protein